MSALSVTTHSVEETLALGEKLGRLAAPCSVIALSGTLGAGKTHLTRGIATGARVADPGLVSSPTYVLLNIYAANLHDPLSKTVFHLDAYRVCGPADLEAMGFDELIAGGGIVVVEWPEIVEQLLPPDRLHVAISAGDDPNERTFAFTATGKNAAALLESLR